MSDWITTAHVTVDPLPLDWRDQLAVRLGQRPRRIGPWAELALYGARLCLDAAGESALPAQAQLRVASLSGPRNATRQIVEQTGDRSRPMSASPERAHLSFSTKLFSSTDRVIWPRSFSTLTQTAKSRGSSENRYVTNGIFWTTASGSLVYLARIARAS